MSLTGSRRSSSPHPSLPVPTGSGRSGVTVLEADAAEVAAAEAAALAGHHLTTPVPSGAALLPPPNGQHLTTPVPPLAVAVPAPRPTASRPEGRRPAPRAGVPMSRTRRGLLLGARTAIAERGLKKTTMQHVAAAAGVAKATLYNHFRTKDDVANALLAFELDRLVALAAELPFTVALPALAEEVGGHPVLRKLGETDPETLTAMLAIDAERWDDIVIALGTALGLSRPAAEMVSRWLLGLVLQPGTASERAAQAATMATLLTAC